jgi:hypothetical protein
MRETVWHGTPSELRRLKEAVARNCACGGGWPMSEQTLCSLHRALCSEQPFLDLQLYARRMRERLLCEEWVLDAA